MDTNKHEFETADYADYADSWIHHEGTKDHEEFGRVGLAPPPFVMLSGT